jgi:predicted nucleotide-binding protein (sugar kinase/HSP70/actin superfamily)
MSIESPFGSKEKKTKESPLKIVDEFLNKIEEYYEAVRESVEAGEEYSIYVYQKKGDDQEMIKNLKDRWDEKHREAQNKLSKIERFREDNPWLYTVDRNFYKLKLAREFFENFLKNEETKRKLKEGTYKLEELRSQFEQQVNSILEDLQLELIAQLPQFNEEELNSIIEKVREAAFRI